jgi:ABC-type phosphate transport system permease subunit
MNIVILLSGIASLIFGIIAIYFLINMMVTAEENLNEVQQQAIKAIEAQKNGIYLGYLMVAFFLILGIIEIREAYTL